jgi:hypothetical protein
MEGGKGVRVEARILFCEMRRSNSEMGVAEASFYRFLMSLDLVTVCV